MPFECRPNTHAERAEAIAAIQAYMSGPEPDPGVGALIERIFNPAKSTYQDARQLHLEAIAARRTASDAADVGDAKFDHAFRLWSRSVVNAEGKPLSGKLSKFMGNTKPGKLVELPYRKELTKIASLFKQLPDNPELQGDPEKLAALKAAVAEFEPLVTADEAATRDQTSKGTAATKAAISFDKAYSKLYRAVSSLIGEEAALAILPRFERRSGKGGGPAGGSAGGSGGSAGGSGGGAGGSAG